MKRWDIINWHIQKYGYISYLEIGTWRDYCLDKVVCSYKVGVDPKPQKHTHNCDKFFKLSSKQFFATVQEKYDIIFIDAYHTYIDTKFELYAALYRLNKGGTIMLHDCNPPTKEEAAPTLGKRSSWMGEVWKTVVDFRTANPDVTVVTIDEDCGCGIIHNPPTKVKKVDGLPLDNKSYEYLNSDRVNLLNLQQWDTYKDHR